MTDLEAKAREWLARSDIAHDHYKQLAALLRSVSAEAREEALKEAEGACELVRFNNHTAEGQHGAYMAACAVRALVGRKEGT